MKRVVWVGTFVLAVTIFAAGYAIEFLTTVLAMAFDLPGPYADDPVAWLWLGVSTLAVVAISFLFCSRFAGHVEKKIRDESTFE